MINNDNKFSSLFDIFSLSLSLSLSPVSLTSLSHQSLSHLSLTYLSFSPKLFIRYFKINFFRRLLSIEEQNESNVLIDLCFELEFICNTRTAFHTHKRCLYLSPKPIRFPTESPTFFVAKKLLRVRPNTYNTADRQLVFAALLSLAICLLLTNPNQWLYKIKIYYSSVQWMIDIVNLTLTEGLLNYVGQFTILIDTTKWLYFQEITLLYW